MLAFRLRRVPAFERLGGLGCPRSVRPSASHIAGIGAGVPTTRRAFRAALSWNAGVGWSCRNRRDSRIGGVVVQFRQLKGLTGLPLEQVRHQFRNENVRTVLPVTADDTGRETLLVATTYALAIVTGETGSQGERWMTRWAPWDVVRPNDEIEPITGTPDDAYRLLVHVDRLTFEARLAGEAGDGHWKTSSSRRTHVTRYRQRPPDAGRRWSGSGPTR